ncbi:uncharacterized protein LOC143900867, partial [Temnothorax americanus]|uniref:uncharacterized protein LOC143900867 n=1 Tax=Temnothorax americanus TaxID=1964332 RepID=UPI0040685164
FRHIGRARAERVKTVAQCGLRTQTDTFLDSFLLTVTPAQVEGRPIPIISGRASKIPPIYERPTTSNISVEEGGVLNVPKSWNRQQLPSSVTRGVRSRPLGDASTKVDTVPLLSPTMESELLKEPWVFPRTKANPTKEEDIAALSAWEEDFQDLSGWCMDTFQGQCDFHIGESTTFKLSGTKYEGNGVSIAEEGGLLKDLTRTTDDEKLDLKMDTVKTTKASNDNRHLLLSPSELVNEYGLGNNNNNEENNASSSWLMSPESTASKSSSSSKQLNADISAPLQSEGHDLDYVSPTSFNAITNQREMWDELRTIETTGSDTFDLLSYLWEDEMRSANVSTDSSAMLKVRSLATSSPVLSFTSTKVKTEEINEPTLPSTRRRMETRATSTITSSTAKTPAASRRSERTRIAATKSKERERVTSTTVTGTKTKDKNGRKRYYEESDSDDDVALSQYRECREKNNEASRRSRMNKKAKESEMTKRATDLERDNKILKMKVEELEKLVTSMRNALLRSALKKEF